MSTLNWILGESFWKWCRFRVCTNIKEPLITARKRSSGQGNIFTSICLSTGEGASIHGGSLSGRPPLYDKERAVRILLECILVISSLHCKIHLTNNRISGFFYNFSKRTDYCTKTTAADSSKCWMKCQAERNLLLNYLPAFAVIAETLILMIFVWGAVYKYSRHNVKITWKTCKIYDINVYRIQHFYYVKALFIRNEI